MDGHKHDNQPVTVGNDTKVTGANQVWIERGTISQPFTAGNDQKVTGDNQAWIILIID